MQPAPLQKDRDALYGQRVHCWVLVLKGKRDQQSDVFVEPTTGRIWSLAESPYTGIESVWNEHQYYVNLQDKPPQVRIPGGAGFDTRCGTLRFLCGNRRWRSI